VAPDEQLFLCLDNRQDLQLRPNWDIHNNNDEETYLSAPFITSLVRVEAYMKRHHRQLSSSSKCTFCVLRAIIALHKLLVYKRT